MSFYIRKVLMKKKPIVDFFKEEDEYIKKAGIAQSVERLPCKQDVRGSIPLTGSMSK